jgi:hypothetical protein
MAKRASLFGAAEPVVSSAVSPPVHAVSPPAETAPGRRYPVAKTREGKRVATVYLEEEALTQLKVLAAKERTTLQELLVEGVNAIFAARGMGRLA